MSDRLFRVSKVTLHQEGDYGYIEIDVFHNEDQSDEPQSWRQYIRTWSGSIAPVSVPAFLFHPRMRAGALLRARVSYDGEWYLGGMSIVD